LRLLPTLVLCPRTQHYVMYSKTNYICASVNLCVLEDIFRIHHTTIGKIIPEVCGAIWKALSGDYIKCPTTADEWMKVARHFKDHWQYPMTLLLLIVHLKLKTRSFASLDLFGYGFMSVSVSPNASSPSKWYLT
jgi:hypothetical protein